jgi:hypothetical protein
VRLEQLRSPGISMMRRVPCDLAASYVHRSAVPRLAD